MKITPLGRLKLIDGSISSYFSIINYIEILNLIKEENKLASVIGDMETNHLGENEDRNKRAMEADDHTKKKSEQKNIREDDNRLKGIETCEVLVCSVVESGMDHINNL